MFLQFFTHILIASLINIKKPILAETGVNQLLIKVIATQNSEIRITEAPPAASTGSNLSVDGTQSINDEDFQAISEASFYEDKKSKDYDEGNDKLLFNRNDLRLNVIKPSAMVWDNCMETNFKDDIENYVKPSDMEMVVQETFFESDKDAVKNIGPTWNKRNVNNTNYSAAMNAWLQKYNTLLNSKMEERRQQKPDFISIKKPTITDNLTETTLTIITTTPQPKTELSTIATSFLSSRTALTTVPIIPITRQVFKGTTEPSQTTQNTATESNVIASFTEDWFDTKSKAKIRFSSLPQRTTYLIPTLRLEDGFHPFSFMSDFFYLIYPFDFPVGKFIDK